MIQGKTGAGKTSIVDAITYALYGKVPRYAKEKGIPLLVKSKGSNKMKVALTFSVGGKRYRIERFYREKPKEDIVRVEEEGRRLNIKKGAIEKWVTEVTGLDYKTFTKVILLPQGEFDRFLKPEKAQHRREILINFLDLEVFSKMREVASDRFRELEGEEKGIVSELEGLEEVKEETLAEIKERINLLKKEIEELKGSLKGTEEELKKAEDRKKIEEELEHYRRRLSDLLAMEGEMEEKLRRIENARKILPYLPYIDRLEALMEEIRSLKIEHEKEIKELEKVKGEIENVEEEWEKVEREHSKLPKYREELQEIRLKISQLKNALSDIEEIERLREELKKAKVRRKKREEELKKLEERLEKGELHISRVKEELESCVYDRKELEDLLTKVERKKVLLKELEDLKAIQSRIEPLEREVDKLESDLSDLKAQLKQKEELLKEQDISSLVQKIREHLHEGDSCPVCGGIYKGGIEKLVSPSGGEDLSQEVERLREEILSLTQELSSRRTKLEHLRDRERELKDKLKENEDLLEEDLESKLIKLQDTAKRREELEAKLKRYQEAYNEIFKDRERARSEVNSLTGEITTLEKTISQKEKRLEESTGGFRSAERVKAELRSLEDKERDLDALIESLEKRREEIKAYKEELERSTVAHRTRLEEIQKTTEKKEREKKEVSQTLVDLFRSFGDLEKAKEYALREEELRELESSVEEYRKDKALAQEKVAELESKLKSMPQYDLEELRSRYEGLKSKHEALVRELGNLESNLSFMEEQLKRKEDQIKRLKEIKKEKELYRRLALDLKSDKIQDFVASLMLEEIVEVASEHLYKFTSTYELSLTDKGDMVVVDKVQGVERNVKSLSGGETFLASLSLALGVSDVLASRSRIESLFIDEGFGSLDEETRERVSDILETVRQNINRMVGIISHIPDLAERFHQKILVKKQGDFSTVEVIY